MKLGSTWRGLSFREEENKCSLALINIIKKGFCSLHFCFKNFCPGLMRMYGEFNRFASPFGPSNPNRLTAPDTGKAFSWKHENTKGTKSLCGFSFFLVKLKMFNQVKCKFTFHVFSPVPTALNFFLSLSLVSVFLNNFCGLAYGSMFYDCIEFTFWTSYPFFSQQRKTSQKCFEVK